MGKDSDSPLTLMPEEVLEKILSDLTELVAPLHGESVAEDHHFSGQARLVCRQWNRLLIPHVFRILRMRNLYEDHEHHDRTWDQLIDCPNIRHAVRRVVIPTAPARKYTKPEARGPNGEWASGFYARLKAAMRRIKDLPTLQAVELHFSKICMVYEPGDFHDRDHLETRTSRFIALRWMFEAIEERRMFGLDSGEYTEIESLTLFNLQNEAHRDFVGSETFKSVAGTIKDLRLLVTVQNREGHETWDIAHDHRVNYEPHLRKELLPTFADSLSSLTLCFHVPWGVASGYFDGQDLLFPHLRTLHLGEFVIGHYDQIDWIVAQKTLSCLRLDRCYIASHMNFTPASLQTWRTPTHDWQLRPKMPHPESQAAVPAFSETWLEYFFPGTWEDVFDRLRAELPLLGDFRLDHRRMRSSAGHFFFNPSNMRADLPPSRYIMFDVDRWERPREQTGWFEMSPGDEAGQRSAWWTEARRGGRSVETREGDSRALRDLLSTVSERRRGGRSGAWGTSDV